MFCSMCQHQEVDGAKFCSKCGQALVREDSEQVNLKFCPSCGSKRENNGKFCSSCGLSFTDQASAYREVAAGTIDSDGPIASGFKQQQDNQQVYARFGQRAMAALIDGVITFVLGIAILLLFFIDVAEPALQLIGFVMGLVYKAGMESSSHQATIGKKAMGLKVTDLEGRRISFGRAAGRFLASYLSALLLGIGYLCALFTDKRQTLHDLMAGTLVQKGK